MSLEGFYKSCRTQATIVQPPINQWTALVNADIRRIVLYVVTDFTDILVFPNTGSPPSFPPTISPAFIAERIFYWERNGPMVQCEFWVYPFGGGAVTLYVAETLVIYDPCDESKNPQLLSSTPIDWSTNLLQSQGFGTPVGHPPPDISQIPIAAASTSVKRGPQLQPSMRTSPQMMAAQNAANAALGALPAPTNAGYPGTQPSAALAPIPTVGPILPGVTGPTISTSRSVSDVALQQAIADASSKYPTGSYEFNQAVNQALLGMGG